MAVYFENIIGNEKLKDMLSAYVKNGMMPHAFIIEGAYGSGKKTTAKSVAAALSCKMRDSSAAIPCMECINCEKIFKGVSPDVIHIDTTTDTRSKSSIGVEVIRELKNHTYMSANELEYKVYIIDEADKMTPGAQNAFLKILEEPVTNVLYFLLCENAQNLLPTVISRAPVIRTSNVQQQQIIDYLSKNAPTLNQNEIAEIASIAGGNVGKALKYSQKDAEYTHLQELRGQVYHFISLHKSDSQKHQFLSFVDEIGDKGNYAADFLRMAYSASRDIILFKTLNSDSFDFFVDTADINKFEKNIKLKYAKKLCMQIEDTLELLHLNQGPSSTASIMQNFAIKTWGAYNL